MGQCLARGVLEDLWDLVDQWDLDQEDLWEVREALVDLCLEDQWEDLGDQWEGLEGQCLVLGDLGDRWDLEVQWDRDLGDQWEDLGDQWGDLEEICRSHHQEQ